MTRGGKTSLARKKTPVGGNSVTGETDLLEPTYICSLTFFMTGRSGEEAVQDDFLGGLTVGLTWHDQRA